MITLEGGGGGLWEQAGGGRAWGWMAFLDAYYILFMFCVLVNLKKKLSLQQNVQQKQLKEGRLYSGLQSGNHSTTARKA